jgi:hypothetical protein
MSPAMRAWWVEKLRPYLENGKVEMSRAELVRIKNDDSMVSSMLGNAHVTTRNVVGVYFYRIDELVAWLEKTPVKRVAGWGKHA